MLETCPNCDMFTNMIKGNNLGLVVDLESFFQISRKEQAIGIASLEEKFQVFMPKFDC